MSEISLHALRKQFIGHDTRFQLADGSVRPQHYLDSGASSLMMKPAFEMATEFLRYYANVHSTAHFSARTATQCFAWAQERVLRLLGADPALYTCIFVGSGATAALNRVARLRAKADPTKDLALVSLMEHHSNDLPHRVHIGEVRHIGLEEKDGHLATVDLQSLEDLLGKYGARVSYVAVTGVSNVTGLVNPLKDISRIAAAHGVPVIVDGAQMIPHMPLSLAALDGVSAVAFSGHKLYAPGSPGVLVAKREFLESMAPVEFGGGMVDSVHTSSFAASRLLPDRELAGTPNIFGAVLLGGVCHILDAIGMDRIYEEERQLFAFAHGQLLRAEGVTMYGHPDLAQFPRVGALSFNIRKVPHALAAAILNDCFGIAVRNECFCAHPYVRELIVEDLWNLEGIDLDDLESSQPPRSVRQWQGMVRASFAIYTTRQDVDALVRAVRTVAADPSRFAAMYDALPDGTFRLKGRADVSAKRFAPQQYLDSVLASLVDPPVCAIV